MSLDLDTATRTSTAKSLVGALLALGGGVVFMFLGLVSVTKDDALTEQSVEIQALTSVLSADLLSCKPGTIQVSSDHRRIRFRRALPQEGEREVLYEVEKSTGHVIRRVADNHRLLAKVINPTFANLDGVLQLKWHAPGGPMTWSWAIERFQPLRRSAR